VALKSDGGRSSVQARRGHGLLCADAGDFRGRRDPVTGRGPYESARCWTPTDWSARRRSQRAPGALPEARESTHGWAPSDRHWAAPTAACKEPALTYIPLEPEATRDEEPG
jgi:hypothetical protein